MYEYLRQFLWIFRHVHIRIFIYKRARVCMCVYVCDTPEQDEGTTPFVVCDVIMAILPHDDALGYLLIWLHSCRIVIWPNQAIYSQLSSTPPFAAIVWKSICVVILTVHFLHCHYMLSLPHTPTHTHTLPHAHNAVCTTKVKTAFAGEIWFMHISIWFISLASFQTLDGPFALPTVAFD